MSRLKSKNRTIVAIAVHPKLNPGDTIFDVDNGYGEKLTVLTRPYWRPWLVVDGGCWWVDFTDDQGKHYIHSPGDAGFPGFNYDDRPCRWVRTQEDVGLRAAETQTWHENNPVDPCDDW